MSAPGEISQLDQTYFDTLIFTTELKCPSCGANFNESHCIQQGSIETVYYPEGDFNLFFNEIRHCNSCKQDYASRDGY